MSIKDIKYLFLLWYMKMLKRKNYLLCLFLNIITLGLFTFYIAKKLKIYEKDSWYSNKYYWILSFICGIIPGILMFFIFYIEIGCKVCKKLSVPLDIFYNYPYFWIVSIIIPVVGWTLFVVMTIYVHTWYVVYIKRGYGEKYIK